MVEDTATKARYIVTKRAKEVMEQDKEGGRASKRRSGRIKSDLNVSDHDVEVASMKSRENSVNNLIFLDND